MNLGYLADALDHWKGCVIKEIDERLNDLHVIPMFTDEDIHSSWPNDRLRLYAKLLHVPQDKILQSDTRFTATTRQEYFAAIADDDQLRDKDFFIDPDIGIEPEKGGNWRHIRLSDISALLRLGNKRVILIYQHASHRSDWSNACLQRLVNYDDAGGINAFAYWAGAASMFLLSRDRRRMDSLHRSFSKVFYSRRLSQILPNSSL
jgi:hypothetical protein